MDTWTNKIWPNDMLSELEWLVRERAKNDNYLKKGDLILTGAYGFPVPINDKKLIEVTSSAFGEVKACLLYTSPSPRDATLSRMPSSA